jgi:serine/threonine protein kinase
MKNLKITLPSGYLIKGYRIEKTIGGGGFSFVYRATNLEANELVAIKEFLPTSQAQRLDNGRVEPISEETAATYRQGIKRFFDEASALAKVNHPNIVHVTNFFRANNTVYMVMRYEEGKDLRWYIKRHSRGLSEKFIRTVFPLLLHGLRELHNNQLLHLDIKPANILLRAGANPLLLDFGASQGALVGSNPVGPNTLTVGFAPIEQHNKGLMGPWTDMYALGGSIWACMSGKAPPPATERATKDKFKSALRTYGYRYSQQLLEAVDWCMQVNQLDRPQSAQALLDFLNQPLEVEPPPSNPGYLARLGLRLPWSKG